MGLAGAPAFALADDQSALRALAEQYWQAEVKKDWKTVLVHLPAEEKKGVKPEDFAKYRNTKTGTFLYQSAVVGEAVVEGDTGWVKVSGDSVMQGFPGMKPRPMAFWQLWRKHEGAWSLMPRAERENVPQVPRSARLAAEEKVLEKRVDGFWRAKEAQDWRSIYDYLPPEFRANTPLQKFLENRSMYLYLTHRFEWVEVIGGKGRVRVSYTRKPNDPSVSKMAPEEQVAIEPWVKIKDQWYRQVASKNGKEG
jgi:hypothetical protein